MKSACFIPIKSYSARVSKKNTKPLNNIPLFHYALNTVLSAGVFSDVYVDTDSDLVKDYIKDKSVKLIERDPSLAEDNANGNDLLNYWSESFPNYNFYFQIFVTSPFLKEDTVKQCLSILTENNDYDSIFTAYKEHTWFWYNNKPTNYNPKILPRSQDATPMIKETTSLYGITKNALTKHGARIGENPCMYFVDQIESIDIDNDLDFFIAEQIFKYEH